MEAFERWDRKEYPHPACYERGPVGRDMLKQRRRTWRATLECVLDQCHHHQSQDVIDWILKELEGE